MFYSNKDHVEEMKRDNDEKLAELNAKLEDCESTLKSHRRELSVCAYFQSNLSIEFIHFLFVYLHFTCRFTKIPVISVWNN